MREVFVKDDVRYILSDIVLTDYCIWIQSCRWVWSVVAMTNLF